MKESIQTALSEGYTEPVRDVLWGHVYFRPAVEAICRSRPFMRLTRIFQLGPAFYTYPGATHTRASHSIGVYHLSRRLLSSLANQGAAEWLTPEGVQSFLCAALLHDLGHFPYTHSLKELPLKAHEELTAEMILAEPVKSLVGKAGGDPYLSAAIVDTRLPSRQDAELLFYRRLLSGALDPDKLDYLTRDARYCGVPYGIQDVDFIYRRLHPQRERGFDIDSRGIPCVEALLFSKYLMYRNVYWHRSVRSATGMIKKAILGGLEAGALAKDELYGLDDQGLFHLLEERSHPLLALAADVREGQVYAPVLEFPFDKEKCGFIEDLAARSRCEGELAAQIGSRINRKVDTAEIVIDLSEAVDFETGLFVRDEDAWFSGGGGPFTTEGLEKLSRTLRMLRIFVHPGLAEGLDGEFLREKLELLRP